MKKKTPASSGPTRDNGFSLVEVLFAVFVLSIGLLGIAGLQIVAKRSNFEAIQRTTATMLANDIVERMRANPAALSSYLGESEPVVNEIAPKQCITGAPCTPEELAARDLWEWQQAILGASDQLTTSDGTSNTGGLVSPSACITNPATNVYVIEIAWRGQTPLTRADSSAACGDDVDDYGDGEYRRLLVLNAFIGT